MTGASPPHPERTATRQLASRRCAPRARATWPSLPRVSPPSPSEQRRNRLLEIAVNILVLVIWGVTVTRATLPAKGLEHWFMWMVGPVALLQLGYASWRYLRLKRPPQED